MKTTNDDCVGRENNKRFGRGEMHESRNDLTLDGLCIYIEIII
jgi:hypothetical protein